MKLARIGINGNEKPVLIDSEDNYRDLSSIIKDLDASTLNFETLEKIKKENIKNLPILDKSREQKIYSKIEELYLLEDHREYINQIYTEIMTQSKKIQ